MGTRETSLIFISEKLLLEGIVPQGLLDSNCFGLRSIEHLDEIVVLYKAIVPSGIIMDLRDAAGVTDTKLEMFSSEIRKISSDTRLPPVPVIGVINPEQHPRRHIFFENGINSLLVHPFAIEDLQADLEMLINLRFRRSVRKNINVPLTLSLRSQTWEATGKVISFECLFIAGDNLPPQGINVLVKAQDVAAFPLNIWAYCWRELKDEGGLVLRFLESSLESLNLIESLPSMVPPGTNAAPDPATQKSTPVLPSTPESVTPPLPSAPETMAQPNPVTEPLTPTIAATATPVAEASPELFAVMASTVTPEDTPVMIKKSYPEPGRFAALIVRDLLQPMSRWLMGTEDPPSSWQQAIQKTSPALRKVIFEALQQNSRLAEVHLLRLILERQLEGLELGNIDLKAKDYDFKEILNAYQIQVNVAAQLLKKPLEEAVRDKNVTVVVELNEIKSSLQRTLMHIQKTLAGRNLLQTDQSPEPEAKSKPVPHRSAPAARATKPVAVARERRQRKQPVEAVENSENPKKLVLKWTFLVLSVLIIPFIYIKLSKPTLRTTPMSVNEVKEISPFFKSGIRYPDLDNSYEVKLEKSWDTLSPSEQEGELLKLAPRIHALDHNFAIRSSAGNPYCRFDRGAYAHICE